MNIYINTGTLHSFMMSKNSSYVCDTLPAPRLALPDDDDMRRSDHVPDSPQPDPVTRPPSPAIQQPARKLCVRHQRMADEGTNLKLQQVSENWTMRRQMLTNCSRWTRCHWRNGNR